MERDGKKVDAVFEGGGVRGIALVGAAAVIEEAGYTFANVAGTSAGAIVASLIAAGYSARELQEIMASVDYARFADGTMLDKVPLVGPAVSIAFEKGIYEGDYFESWLRELLVKKNVRTFADLVVPECATQPKYRYRLQVVASDVTSGKMLKLPHDIVTYGTKPDDLEVARAVRMSMSIPLFYEPVKLEVNGAPHYIVDGGLLSNFPVWIFDDGSAEPPWPTFGFRLVADGSPENVVDGPLSFMVALFKTMLHAHDERYMEDADFVRTIAIPSGTVSAIDFGLTAAQRDTLYEAGREAARAFLRDWDFEAYKRGFREKEPPTRGERLRGGVRP